MGGDHDGIRQMFHVIEDARMIIGAKSAATLSTGYLNALEYAKERIQSADLTQSRDKAAPRVPIIRHPDVRRMLMTQKAHAEGMRALVMYSRLGPRPGASPSRGARTGAKLTDLLLPLVKGYSSEKAYELLGQSLQVLRRLRVHPGLPLEQYIRDAKIDTIYEGTTAIQALDLFFRKIATDQGATLMRSARTSSRRSRAAPEDLGVERELLGKALEDVQAHIGVMVGHSMASMQDPPALQDRPAHQRPAREPVGGDHGLALIRHAEIALEALDGARRGRPAFYEGKIASARYFATTVLPKAKLRRELAEAEDGSLMDLPVESF